MASSGSVSTLLLFKRILFVASLLVCCLVRSIAKRARSQYRVRFGRMDGEFWFDMHLLLFKGMLFVACMLFSA